MNAREVYNALNFGSDDEKEQALMKLAAMVKMLSVAVLEVAGTEHQGSNPLSRKSRVLLTEYVIDEGDNR